MRPTAAACCLALAIACAPAEAPEAAATLSLATFAGDWQVTSQLEGVEAPVESRLTSSADGSTWTMTLEGRDPVALQVSLEGDSLIAVSAEYESILRPGTMVTVRTANMMHGDMMRGTLVATYRTPEGEEVVRGTTQSTRIQ